MEAPAASHGVEQQTEACNMFLILIKVIIARHLQKFLISAIPGIGSVG
jgi:hypothetical protein